MAALCVGGPLPFCHRSVMGAMYECDTAELAVRNFFLQYSFTTSAVYYMYFTG